MPKRRKDYKGLFAFNFQQKNKSFVPQIVLVHHHNDDSRIEWYVLIEVILHFAPTHSDVAKYF